MLEQYFDDVYTKFKLQFYRKLFSRFGAREASLTAVETFCVESIHALKRPTINEFATFTHISAPNAAYKINSLVKKGYIRKIQSKEDKREYYLEVTEKFHTYYNMNYDYVRLVTERMRGRFTDEQLSDLEEMLKVMSSELMYEVALPVNELPYELWEEK